MQISNVVDLAAVTWEHYIPFGIPGRNLNKEGSMSYNTIRHQGREDHPRRNNRHRHKNCYYKPRGLQHSMTHIMSTSLPRNVNTTAVLRHRSTCTWPSYAMTSPARDLHVILPRMVHGALNKHYATNLPHISSSNITSSSHLHVTLLRNDVTRT